MSLLAFQSGDWAIITIAILILGSVIGGMVKFVQAIRLKGESWMAIAK